MQTFGAFIVSLLVASSGLALAAPAAQNGKTVTVTAKQNDKFVANGPLALARAYAKYNKPLSAQQIALLQSAGKQKRQTGSVGADPQPSDIEYLAEVHIGTPAQKVLLDFDTGSSDLWVLTSQLNGLNGQATYDASRSSSAKQLNGASWSITYADQSGASGDVFNDVVSIGGLSVKKQAVERASQVTPTFASGAESGLVGLAWDSINTVSPKPQKTWFSNIKSSLAAPVFTSRLRHNADGSYNFGFIDKTQFTGDITYTAVDNSNGFWAFTSTGYTVGNGQQNSQSINGIADTGTTLLLLPDAVVNDYYSNVSGATNDQTAGGYVFDCSAQLPDFSFGVESSTITIPGSFINFSPVNPGDNSRCFGGLQSDGGQLSIFGDVALKAAFVVWDAGQQRLGWATGA
ncbi:Uncharacterized protein TCAP_06505 [Tolypocladium capitatum]|uniref:Peptidase A1 domain-containing protein n=1 Tax=Tolypocladium capitatum TaxID=45235 RepID=A0A2K3Q7P7_9HYPO|nr:Uncharacterized protein TCAP_06505 [Tolypocladium capitatum]